MELEQILLKKEEIPIRTIKGTLSNPVFTVPIHPSLLRLDIKIDPTLAHQVFPKAAEEWYIDLKKAVKHATADERKWITDVFLKTLEITESCGQFGMRGWHDDVIIGENGFATSLSISRNHGGTLYLDPLGNSNYIYKFYVRFFPKKFREYRCEKTDFDKDCSRGVRAYIYSGHNIDHYPGALFLRNWAIPYLNEALKQADAQKPF